MVPIIETMDSGRPQRAPSFAPACAENAGFADFECIRSCTVQHSFNPRQHTLLVHFTSHLRRTATNLKGWNLNDLANFLQPSRKSL